MKEWLADKEILIGTILIVIAGVAYSLAPIFA